MCVTSVKGGTGPRRHCFEPASWVGLGSDEIDIDEGTNVDIRVREGPGYETVLV